MNNKQAKNIDKIRIGTRGSQLAIAQSEEVKARLQRVVPDSEIEIIKITTTGDREQNRNLAEIGGKGLFTKEIEEALQDGRIDIAVHSMKDMPDTLPAGLIIECVLERENPFDAFVANNFKDLASLKKGAILGTSSVRRQSQILAIRPDLKIVPFRGNVGTRLDKLDRGEVDATILAVAGLKRINLEKRITEILSEEVLLPAVAQGAIGIECAEKNTAIRQLLAQINHHESYIRVLAERAFLKALGGTCTTPISALAKIKGKQLELKTLIASPDGKNIYKTARTGTLEQAEEMGNDAGRELKARGSKILEWRN